MANTKYFRTNVACAGTTTLAVLNVSGAAAFSGASSFPGGITGGISVAGNSTFQNNLTVQGNLQVNGSFSFSGGSVFPDNTFQVQNASDATKYMNVDLSGATAGFGSTLTFSQTANRVITFPDASFTVVGHNTVQTLTSKNIDAASNSITNLMDAAISASAAISLAKLASLTASKALVSDGSGVITPSVVTSTELALLSGLTAALVTISDTQTLTNKVIDADANSISNIADANVKSGAAIARAKLANGSANHVLINDAGGVVSSEAQLAASRGGTGQDMSASSGVLHVAAGVFSASAIVNADVDAAAAIARSKLASGTANYVLVNDGSGVMSEVSKLNESQGGTNQSTYAQGDILYASGANTLSKLAAGSVGQILKTNDSGVPAWTDWVDPSLETRIFDDWISDGAGQMRWLGTPVGTGATNNTGNTLAQPGHPGILELVTGTTTTGQAARYLGGVTTGSATAGFYIAGGASSQEWLVQLSDLSNGTDRYVFDVGLFDAETLAVDAVRFRYSDNLNAGNWTAETIASSVITATDSGVAAVAGSWVKLRIDINAAGNSITFYVNDVLVATHTTNITAALVAPRCRIIKVLGTTSRTAYIDYFKMYKRFSSAR